MLNMFDTLMVEASRNESMQWRLAKRAIVRRAAYDEAGFLPNLWRERSNNDFENLYAMLDYFMIYIY